MTNKTQPITTSNPFPPLDKVPQHVGIIMDGNGRWAKQRHQPRTMGHRVGTETLRKIVEVAPDFGIKILTIYAFSTENWKRPKTEVKGLMGLFHYYFDKELNELADKGVKLRHLGETNNLKPALYEKLSRAVKKTAGNSKLTLNIAFNYGGRAEIITAIKKIIAANIPPEDITEDLVSSYLYTGGQVDPDLIIRTSGEFRTSNFLTWQGAYSEYYITPTLWPDFDEKEFYKALQFFNQRKRRFGGLNDEEELEDD